MDSRILFEFVRRLRYPTIHSKRDFDTEKLVGTRLMVPSEEDRMNERLLWYAVRDEVRCCVLYTLEADSAFPYITRSIKFFLSRALLTRAKD